jgi:hypothetical protein
VERFSGSATAGSTLRSITPRRFRLTILSSAATLLWQRVERQILADAPVVPTPNPLSVDLVLKRLGTYQHHPVWWLLIAQTWVK